MEKDKIDHLLDESLQKLKSQKMDWDFEDFLEKAEKLTIDDKMITPEIQRRNRIYYAVVASLALIFGSYFLFKNFNSHKAPTSEMVKNEILRQRNRGTLSDTLGVSEKTLAENDTIKKRDTLEIRSEKKLENTDENAVLNQILPHRSRSRKPPKTLMAHRAENKTAQKQDSATYQPEYVMVNGKKIDDENEAIKIARGALNMMSANLSKTFTEVDIQDAPGN